MTDPAGATRIFETIPGTIPGECGSDLETAKAIIARLSAAELEQLAPSFIHLGGDPHTRPQGTRRSPPRSRGADECEEEQWPGAD